MIKNGLRIRKNNFINGMARALDLGATLNNYEYIGDTHKEDYYALKSDWVAVGKDIETAIGHCQGIIYGRTK